MLALGSLLGLIRDMYIARYFGASADTDAFLVAWTIPETVTPVLGEGALLYLLVPLLSREIELRGSPQRVLDRTFLPVVVTLAVLAGAVALAAPAIVAALAPGLVEPEVAVRCVRVASVTVLFLGLSGYMTATLRATGSFLISPWVYTVYNVVILALMMLFHEQWGVYSAAVGLALGSAGMVALQSLPLLRRVSLRSLRFRLDRRLLLGLLSCLPIGAYALSRQAQVFVERILGSALPPGAISHLNYATKLAQIPMVVAVMVTAVSLPSLARHLAAQRQDEFRSGVQRSLRLGVLIVAPAIAALFVLAPQLIRVLFFHGAFDATDVEATTDVLRVYVFGLLGQTLVGATAAFFWAAGRPTWYPAVAMLTGLVATVLISVGAVLLWRTPGIALGNAAGISVSAALLLIGVRRRVVDLGLPGILFLIGRASVAAAAGGAAAWVLSLGFGESVPAVVTTVVSSALLALVYLGAAWFLRVAEVRGAARALSDRLLRRQGVLERR